MSWVTVIWSVVGGACLTLALVHGLVWFRRRTAWVSFFLAVMALGTAGMAAIELRLMMATTGAEYAVLIRWYHVPIWVAFLALVGFVQLHLSSARLWLGLLACAIRTVSLIINFTGDSNLNYREITAIRPVHFLGEAVTTVEGVPNPWMLLGQLSLLLLIVFVLDAALGAWRSGQRRRAMTVGGSLLFFVTLGTIQAVLVYWGLIRSPMLGSPYFVGIVAAMGFELSQELLRAAELSRELLVAEADLRASQERLNVAADAAGAGLWSFDAGARVFWATPKALSLFGFPEGTQISLDTFLAKIHTEDQPRLKGVIEQALSSEQDIHVEYRAMSSDGRTRWFSSRGRSIRSAGHAGPHLMGVTMDITGRKAMEAEATRQRAELEHLSRVASLSELSGSLAHELNQPLAIILSNAQAAQRLVAQDPPDLPEVRAILADIVSEDRRAGDVIKRLRALLKRGEPNRVPLSINSVIEEVLQLMRSDLIGRGVVVSLKLSGRLPEVSGDRIPLEQVLLNLITNACDAMAGNLPSDRQITIATGEQHGTVSVSVRDLGCGLPAEPERLFEAFYTTKPNGLGMGLSICRSIVAAHAGRLWAEPNPDRGVTFHMTLPVQEVPK